MIEILLQIDNNDPTKEAVIAQMIAEGWVIRDLNREPYTGHDKVELHFWFRKELTTQNK